MNDIKKKCTQCLIEKPLDMFSLNRDGKFGRTSQCKECRAENRMFSKSKEKFNVIKRRFPKSITSESCDPRIHDLYHEVQMDNLSNGYTGVNSNNRNAKEVDHIVPISKGGLHVFSNLQVLTVSENRSKKAKRVK